METRMLLLCTAQVICHILVI